MLLLLASTSFGQSRDDLLSQLKEPGAAERKKALQGLRTLKEVQPDLMDAVAEQLVDEDREVRLEAATTLTQLAIRLGCTLEDFPECQAFDGVLDNTPTVEHRHPPRYPRQAIQRMAQGTVVVQLLVLEDGSVTEVHAVRGNAPFVQAAVEAVSKHRYKPAKRKGRPVPFAHLLYITFKLK
jgi:TonB family protein